MSAKFGNSLTTQNTDCFFGDFAHWEKFSGHQALPFEL